MLRKNLPQILPRNKQRKSPLKSVDFRGLWSEWGDSNSQHLAPKASALPIALHPVISFFTPRLVPGIFRVCGQSCGQQQISNQIQPAPKPPVRPCVKAFQAFANNAMDAAVDCPKASALPIALHPVISFSLPRLVPGIFLSVGIPVVNRKFSAKSNPRQSHVFARVSTRSGLSQPTRWMPLSIIPKQARYQLRYTRLFFDTRRILTHTGALCNAFFVAISFGLC